MQRRDSRFILLLIFMLLGIVLSVQFRSTLQTNVQKTSSKYEIEQLIALLNEEKKIGASLKASISENEKIRDANLKAAFSNMDDSFIKRQYEDLDNAKIKAGLTDVKGRGIIIKLDDAPVRKPQDLINSIIHDSDIKKILSDIKKAGAQAISINGERIISTSEPICAGPTILINKNRYPVPYTIKIIGDPDVLYKSIDESDRMFAMRRDGIRTSIEKSREIVIEGYHNDIDSFVSDLEVVGK